MNDHDPREFALGDDERRELGRWAAEGATRALALFESRAPDEARPRKAFEELRAYNAGGPRTARLRSAIWAALSCAEETDDPVAEAAARSIGVAAGTPFVHALATPHQSKHLLAPTAYRIRARSLLATGGTDAIADEEIHWATAHASPTVREVLRRFPARADGRGWMSALMYRLDVELRRTA
ncbi:putative immunity protein [Nocardiopsis alba]|uniref:putative immunity protein n=1 Tax=Nocardiopsis alba TaxID=53437 RepID=UPI0033FEE253